MAHLVHEGLQAGAGVSLFLAVVGQVEEGDVVMALPKELEQGVDHGARHAGEGHDVHQAAGPLAHEVPGFADTQDGLPFKGRVQVVLGQFQGLGDSRFFEVLDAAVENLFQAVLVPFLDPFFYADRQELPEMPVNPGVILGGVGDIEEPLADGRHPDLAPQGLDLPHRVFVGELVGPGVDFTHHPHHGPAAVLT